ncbi:hypothetical protein CEUSTIGMA_g10001.t1 [Chlamydomonas eustigma]|uniref:Uncharacterized protein n=1 Tax=Chlamydomonas eustigma TaxID=1157962 RepID=A0A250XHL6_9CHLO|nr:hypothetical protein CEUSTIGMA_g10001.t1 [Chlamydomonas eustigma]|eukprot:GAX82575.1 hypothetical protein CEUSTIGMA_g10001.t1 [Chlamydomonas eustigma]
MPAGNGADGQPQQVQQQNWLGNWAGTIARFAFMWMLMSWFKGGGKPQQSGNKDPATAAVGSIFPRFEQGTLVDMYCFISEKPFIRYYDVADLMWSETGIAISVSETRKYSYYYEPSEAVQRNGSVYLHTLFAKAGLPINPSDPDYDESMLFGNVHNLIGYYPRPKNSTGVKLLSGDALPTKESEEKDLGPREIISFLKPNITVQLVDHYIRYPARNVPQQIAPYLQYAEDGSYYPVIHFNEFWLLRDKMVPMNETVTNVTLHFEIGHTSMWWWQLMIQMEQSFSMQTTMGLQSEGESDEFKRVLLEGNPYLLAVTMVVSMLHTVFDVLAFKNDIGFWKNNKSMEGLSARSVIINAFCQLIILLYLVNNETSMVILFSSFVGTGIEFWKVTKAMNVTFDATRYPYIHFADRLSYTKTKTKEYDEEATRYLSYVLYPLVIGYSIYSLVYNKHKSWYSWILSSLVGAVYMFGFILMCPQLYLNYKLKSVAHLPWRQMTYKFLNTIIDDLFAFVIKMPLLHRLSVFRDDVVFLIFLYQRWIYRVDKTRVNEFGWAGADDSAPVEGAEALPLEDSQAISQDKSEGGQSTGTDETLKKRKNGKKETSKESVPVIETESGNKKDK